MSVGMGIRRQFQWSLNDSLLTDLSNVVLIQHYIKEYLLHNSTLKVSPVTLWEAQKVVLRGDLIKLTASLKVRKENLIGLEDAFYIASEAFKQVPNTSTLGKLQKTRAELDLTLTELADKHLRRAQHKFFFKVNKSDSMWARRLRSSDLTAKPIYLNLGADLYTTNPAKIVKLFGKKLEALYRASPTFDRIRAEELFSSVVLPSIPTSL